MPDILIQPVPLGQKKEYIVEVPGSKSITNRALLLAALANGKSTLTGVLFSDDTRHFLSCLVSLGFHIEVNEPLRRVTVFGEAGRIPSPASSIHVGSAGTAARFLTAFLGISACSCFVDASEQMKKRPMQELFQALTDLGSSFSFPEKEGFLPVQFSNATPVFASEVTINIDKSSQFLSALLISACLLPQDLTVHVTGTHGMAYIQMTIAMMKQFGVTVEQKDKATFFIPHGQRYHARDYFIEPDVSAACYFYAMAPLLGTSVTVKDIPEHPLQGDISFLSLLKQMNCTVERFCDSYRVIGNPERHFPGISANLSAFSDQTMTLAVLAPFADSPTEITGISHIRYQECDRLHAILSELQRIGIPCEELPDGIRIFPGTPHGAAIETYQDHRMAMAFSLIGLRTDGILIKGAECCAKTFESYFDLLKRLLN